MNLFFAECDKFNKKMRDDRIASYSAQAAFFIILSFFPFIMFLLTLLQYLPFSKAELLDLLSRITPDQVYSFLAAIVEELYAKSSGTVLSVTIIAAIWTASRGILGIYYGLDKVYGAQREKTWIWLRLRSMVFTIILAIMLIILLALYVFGNQIHLWFTNRLPWLAVFSQGLIDVRDVVGLAVLTLFFALTYIFLPYHRPKAEKNPAKPCTKCDKCTKCLFCSCKNSGECEMLKSDPAQDSILRQLPGAIIASIGWLGFSHLYSFYIDNMSNMTYTYGSLTAIVLCMVWLYTCMSILIFGAEFNTFYPRLITLITDSRNRKKLEQQEAEKKGLNMAIEKKNEKAVEKKEDKAEENNQ